MTKTTPDKRGVGAREAGRQLGCSHTYLLRLAREKRVPRHEDGTFDVPAVRAALAAQTDPTQIRGDNPERWSQGGNRNGNSVTSDHAAGSHPSSLRGVSLLAVEAAKHTHSEFEAGFVSAVIALAHQVGAIAGLAAAEEGAPLPIAYGIGEAFPVYFIDRAEALLREMPSFRAIPAGRDLPTRYAPDLMDRLGWDVLARERGETPDLEAWAAQAHERRQREAA